MPIHGQIIRQGINILSRYYRLEGKAFTKLYTGFPQSKTIGRGVRHGLTAGSTIGSLISDDSPGNGNGVPLSPKQHGTKTYSQNKTRNRFATSSRDRCPKFYNNSKYSRRSRSG